MYISYTRGGPRLSNLNGGTINIITKQDEITTVEIVDVCPEMNEPHWRTDKIHDELIRDNLSIKRIFGQKRIKYEEMKLIEEKIKCDKYEMFEKSSDEYTILKECEQKEYDQIERDFHDKYYNKELFNNTLWDDTFEITKTEKINTKA